MCVCIIYFFHKYLNGNSNTKIHIENLKKKSYNKYNFNFERNVILHVKKSYLLKEFHLSRNKLIQLYLIWIIVSFKKISKLKIMELKRLRNKIV